MFNKFKQYFLSGLVVFLPVTLTIYSFIAVINFTDGLLSRVFKPLLIAKFGFYFYGLSILIGIYIIVLIGFFVTNFLGRKIYVFFENLLIKLPFFRQLYPAIKEMALFLFKRDRVSQFKEVVIVEYPRKGIYSFGFMTNDSSERVTKKIRQDTCNVFIPSAPGPLTGFVVMIPRKEINFTDISVEEAFKFILSGGVVNPQ